MNKSYLIILIAIISIFYTGCGKDEEKEEIEESNEIPIANFSANPRSGAAPLTVTFTDHSENLPTSWLWTLGDNSTSTIKNPIRTYNNEGSYSVTLSVMNKVGSDTKIDTNYIIVTASNTNPEALFTVSPSSGTINTIFAFNASGSTDDYDPISNLQVRWDFDGNGSWDTDWDTVKTQNYQYSNDGSYTTQLEVKDTEGLISQYTKSIMVEIGCGGQTSFIYGGQTYEIIEIGSQCWMAENLNYETPNSWWYENTSANGNVYGRLYTWDAALNACPDGWHLPSDEEWKQMEMALGMNQSEADDTDWRGTDEGEKMKSESGWEDDGNGTNSSGFNALPGGRRYRDGSFGGLGYGGGWWSSAENSGLVAWPRRLGYNSDQVGRSSFYKTYGFSVRCLKD